MAEEATSLTLTPVSELMALLERVEELIESLPTSRELMNAKEAADFLRLPYTEFKRLAPTLPRHAVTERRYVYSRRELLKWYFSR